MRDCLIYLGDIVIFSANIDDHIIQLVAVFERLASYNFTIKPSKCEFFKNKITYPGHVVSHEGIQADPSKTDAVRNWPILRNVKQV